MYPTKPISKLVSAAGFTVGLALATTTMSASVVFPTDGAASPQATVATEHAPSSSSSLIEAITGSDIGLTTRNNHQFTHFSDLFVSSDDRAAAGGALSETVTAALFGGGERAGRDPHRSARSMFVRNRASGPGLVPRRVGNGIGNGLGFSGGGGGSGGLIDPGDDPGDGDGGMFDDDFNTGGETIESASGDGGGGSNAATVPFPPAVWIGLVGLASVGLMRRCAGARRKVPNDLYEVQ